MFGTSPDSITRRSSPLSTIVYRDAGGAYSQLYSNPFGNEQQVRRNRYIIPAGEYTGNPALDKMIADGDGAIKTMRALNDSIQDETISRQIDRLEEVSSRIFRYVKDNPAKLPQIRKFMSYYLPTTIKLLTAYDQMSRQGVSGENITGTMKKVEGMMSTIVRAFEKQLDSLFGDEAMDISTDITVLENMMVREGLAADDLHKTAQSAPQTQPPQDTDGGITLEL